MEPCCGVFAEATVNVEISSAAENLEYYWTAETHTMGDVCNGRCVGARLARSSDEQSPANLAGEMCGLAVRARSPLVSLSRPLLHLRTGGCTSEHLAVVAVVCRRVGQLL